VYEVRLQKKALKYYEALKGKDLELVEDALKDLERDPTWHNPHVAPLYGKFEGLYRYRKGDHRIFFDCDAGARIVDVLAIRYRRDAYR
jgi:mRNA interferase RelE/StbE